MSHANLTASLAGIRTTATEAGIDWPDPLAEALAEADALQQTALPPADRRAVATAVADAVRNGDDPTSAPAVLAALTATLLAEVVPPGSLADRADQLRADALADHAADLYGRLKQAVAAADQVIAGAREAVHHLDPFNPEQPPSLRPNEAKLWVMARDATLVVERALSCRSLLGTAMGHRDGGGGRYVDVLAIADLSADQLDSIRTVRPSFRDVIAAGWRLSLATPAEHRERTEAINQQRQQQTQRDADGFRDQWRKTHGVQVLG